MSAVILTVTTTTVALLAEGVGRNQHQHTHYDLAGGSPSSRRAWVEILVWKMPGRIRLVALLAEGVGRNVECTQYAYCSTSRPPRGGRG